MGHARPPRRVGGREGTRHLQQAGDRGVRHRGVQPAVPRERVPLRRRLGGDDGARRRLARYGRRLRHLRQLLHRVGVVGVQAPVGPGAGVRGLQSDAALPALRHKPQFARGRAGLSGGHARPQRVRSLSYERGANPPTRRGLRRAGAARLRRRALDGGASVAPRVDDDAVDAHGQPRARGRPGGAVRPRGERDDRRARRRRLRPRGARPRRRLEDAGRVLRRRPRRRRVRRALRQPPRCAAIRTACCPPTT